MNTTICYLYSWKNDIIDVTGEKKIISIDVTNENILNIFELIKLDTNIYRITRVLKNSYGKFSSNQVIHVILKSPTNSESVYWNIDYLNNISEIDINDFAIGSIDELIFYSGEIDKSVGNIIKMINDLNSFIPINNENYDIVENHFTKLFEIN